MAKLIITVRGTPNINGLKQREFVWSAERKLYLYKGRELDDTEFNAEYELCMKRNYDMNPRVMVVSSGGEPRVVERVVVKTEPAPAAPPPPPTMTVEDAVETLLRLAPEKLAPEKRKPGRPAKVAVAADIA